MFKLKRKRKPQIKNKKRKRKSQIKGRALANEQSHVRQAPANEPYELESRIPYVTTEVGTLPWN